MKKLAIAGADCGSLPLAMMMALSAGAGVELTTPTFKPKNPKNTHLPHQGSREKARRMRQIVRGII